MKPTSQRPRGYTVQGQSVDDLHVCSKERDQHRAYTVSSLGQIASHGRAQVKPYDPTRKAAEAAARRARPTPPENCLEKALRAAGSMWFTREEIILGYVVDFFFPEANVIVEVDGGQRDGIERLA